MHASARLDPRTDGIAFPRFAGALVALATLAAAATPLAGQLDSALIRAQCEVVHPIEDQSILYGSIIDGRSGTSLPGSRVHLMWQTRGEDGRLFQHRVAADSDDGTYVFCDVPRGTRLTTWADALGLTSHRVAFDLSGGETVREDLHVTLRRALGTVSGALLDDQTEQPVSGATVQIPGAAVEGMTDSHGRFRLRDVPVGMHELVVRHIGYGEPKVDVAVVHGVSTHARIRLAPRAIAVEPISVTISTRRKWLEDNDFYYRLESRLGSFVTPEEIDRQPHRTLAEVLRTVPAVNLRQRCMPHCQVEIQMAGQTMQGCIPAFYVNGRRVHQLRDPDDGLIDLDTVAVGAELSAVEVYRGISETPPQFYGRCGSVVIWTRRGAR